MKTFSVALIGKVIDLRKQIRALKTTCQYGCGDGTASLGYDQDKLKEAEELVLAAGGGGGRATERKGPRRGPDPIEGETHTGKITGIQALGVFVESSPEDGSTPGLEGLVHISELARDRIRNCEGYVNSLGVDVLTVKYIGMDRGKIKLSRKALLPGGSDEDDKPAAPLPTMAADEIVHKLMRIAIYRNRYIIVTNELHKRNHSYSSSSSSDGKVVALDQLFHDILGPGPGSGVHGL
jgi:predicted RNA-binding protein with RPS1 domain